MDPMEMPILFTPLPHPLPLPKPPLSYLISVTGFAGTRHGSLRLVRTHLSRDTCRAIVMPHCRCGSRESQGTDRVDGVLLHRPLHKEEHAPHLQGNTSLHFIIYLFVC
jgi:hypothetical protein